MGGKEEEANEVRKELKKAQFELGNIAKQLKMKEEYVVWAKEDIENQRKNHEEDLRMHEEEIKNLRLSHETKLDSLKARLETEYNLKTETLREENKRLLGTNTSKISMLEDELRMKMNAEGEKYARMMAAKDEECARQISSKEEECAKQISQMQENFKRREEEFSHRITSMEE